MKVVYAERARHDIAAIYDYIALSHVQAAQAVEDAIRATCEGLADFPFAAPATDEPQIRRAPLVRFPYTIFYRVDVKRERIEIARVIHAARITDLGRLPGEG